LTLPVVISRGASTDIEEARYWYEAQQAGLGNEFLDALGHAFDRITAGPMKYPVVIKDARRALLPRFPYSIYFRTKDHEIRILAVLHQHRDPKLARQRLR
jgi:toxin ParE1/3/4